MGVKTQRSQKRVCTLPRRAFKEDWQRAAPQMASSNTEDHVDVVRPGRFMAALDDMESKLVEENTRDVAVLRRFREIKDEALQALMSLSGM